jgi:hypothetical protein
MWATRTGGLLRRWRMGRSPGVVKADAAVPAAETSGSITLVTLILHSVADSPVGKAARSVHNTLLAEPVNDISRLLNHPSEIPNAVVGLLQESLPRPEKCHRLSRQRSELSGPLDQLVRFRRVIHSNRSCLGPTRTRPSMHFAISIRWG